MASGNYDDDERALDALLANLNAENKSAAAKPPPKAGTKAVSAPPPPPAPAGKGVAKAPITKAVSKGTTASPKMTDAEADKVLNNLLSELGIEQETKPASAPVAKAAAGPRVRKPLSPQVKENVNAELRLLAKRDAEINENLRRGLGRDIKVIIDWEEFFAATLDVHLGTHLVSGWLARIALATYKVSSSSMAETAAGLCSKGILRLELSDDPNDDSRNPFFRDGELVVTIGADRVAKAPPALVIGMYAFNLKANKGQQGRADLFLGSDEEWRAVVPLMDKWENVEKVFYTIQVLAAPNRVPDYAEMEINQGEQIRRLFDPSGGTFGGLWEILITREALVTISLSLEEFKAYCKQNNVGPVGVGMPITRADDNSYSDDDIADDDDDDDDNGGGGGGSKGQKRVCGKCGGTRKRECPHCDGRGQWMEGSKGQRKKCNPCKGSGEIRCGSC